MSNVPSAWVGKLLGNPKTRLLPCGHVQLIKAMDRTAVEFEDGQKYLDELQKQL
jgi:hypothetical protein